MDALINVLIIVLALTGGIAWLFVLGVVVFYWLCQIPPRD